LRRGRGWAKGRRKSPLSAPHNAASNPPAARVTRSTSACILARAAAVYLRLSSARGLKSHRRRGGLGGRRAPLHVTRATPAVFGDTAKSSRLRTTPPS